MLVLAATVTWPEPFLLGCGIHRQCISDHDVGLCDGRL